MTPYDNDVYAWSQEQAALLDGKQWDALDIANLIEEILSVGASQYTAVSSAVYQQAMDELGFEAINVTEHHFDGDGYCPSVLLWNAAAAARTKRALLGAANLRYEDVPSKA